MQRIRQLYFWILDTLFPETTKHTLHSILSYEEIAKLPRAAKLSSGLVGFTYTDARVRGIVWRIKFRADRQLARRAGQALAQVLGSEVHAKLHGYTNNFLIIPIPLSR